MRKFILLMLAGALATTTAHAQKRRITNDLVLWPELQAEYALQNGDYSFLSAGGQRSTNSGINNDQAFYIQHLRAGYEHFSSEHWSLGGTLRYQHATGNSYVIPEILLRHSGKIGAFGFGQRLSAEYQFAPTSEQTRAVTRLRLDVDRVFPLGDKLALRPRLSYELAAYLRLQRDENEPKERFIDFSTLRAEVGLRLSDHVDITPWFGYLAKHQFVLDQTESDGTPIPGGRRNFVDPTLGLEARFTLFQGGSVFERRQLPTQH